MSFEFANRNLTENFYPNLESLPPFPANQNNQFAELQTVQPPQQNHSSINYSNGKLRNICNIIYSPIQKVSYYLDNKTKAFPIFSLLILFSEIFLIIIETSFNLRFLKFFLILFFSFFIWYPNAIEIERSSGTIRYTLNFLINFLILLTLRLILSPYSFNKIDYPIYFMLFESCLIYLVNQDKVKKISCLSVKHKYFPILLTIYFCFIFRNILLIIIPPLYAFVYYKWLSKTLTVKKQLVLKYEKTQKIQWIKMILGENFIINEEQVVIKESNHNFITNKKQINMVNVSSNFVNKTITHFDIIIESCRANNQMKDTNENLNKIEEKQMEQLTPNVVVDINA